MCTSFATLSWPIQAMQECQIFISLREEIKYGIGSIKSYLLILMCRKYT